MRIILILLLLISIASCKKTPLDKGSAQMIYMRDESPGKWNFYINDVTGTNEKKIVLQSSTFDSVLPSSPNLSSDGKIYFLGTSQIGTSQTGNNTQIYCANLDGTDIIRISNCLNCHYDRLRISTTGHRLVYEKYESSTKQIVATSNFDGTNEKQLFDLRNENALDERWFPDGKRVVYVGTSWINNEIVNNIFSINWDGSGKSQLTNNNSRNPYYRFPSVSPDGNKISYIKFGSPGGLFVSDINGTNEHLINLDSSIYLDYLGNWSKDGQYIVFTDDNHQLFVVNPYDSSLRHVPVGFSVLPSFEE